MTASFAQRLLLTSATAIFLTGGSAWAADAAKDNGPDSSTWDLAFGVGITSDYISRGLTQTNGGPAIQPWAELTANDFFYVGYWGSNVDDGTVATWENDFSVGIRPKLGALNFDLGYVRYIYGDSAFADPSGELYGEVTVNPIDSVTLGASLFHDPDAGNTYYEANGSLDLQHNVSLSGAVGLQTFGDGSASETSWNAGASWSPESWVTVDARYHGGPTANKFLVTLSFQSSLSELRAHNH